MTISNQVASAYYTGDGVTTQFPVPFKFNDPSELMVSIVLLSTKAATVLSPAQFTATGAGNANGGYVTYTPAISSLYKIVIQRNMPLAQNLDLEQEGALRLEDIETQLDNLVMMIQQVRAELSLAAGNGQISSIVQGVTGPNSAVTDRIATFADSVGNRIKAGGLALSDLSLVGHVHPETFIAVMKQDNFAAVSNSVLTTDSELQFALAANTLYMINLQLYVNAGATPGFKWGITGPALPSSIYGGCSDIDDAGNFVAYGASAYAQIRNAAPGANRRYVINARLRIANGANAGTFAVQFAQNTSDVAASTLLKGSFLEYKAV